MVLSAEIEPTEDALAEAEAFIANKAIRRSQPVLRRVGQLIDGYQSSYGMELLASVHWVAAHEPGVRSVDEAITAVHGWNDRKKLLMQPDHVKFAWHRLAEEGWLSSSAFP